MVHGVCSSAGCFSMTDEQVADIYAIARDSFAGGQREIQLQSYPFHMTAENMAKFRLDPNIDFWKNLKDGSDHFEVTKAEPSVLVCGKHYVFDATAKDEVSGSEPCPALKRDELVEAEVAEKAEKDDAKVAELAASGVKPDAPRLCGRRPKSGFHRLQGYERSGRAGQWTAGDRPQRPGEAGAGGGEGRHGRRGQEARRERCACAHRGSGRAAGSDDGRRRLGAREPVWRDARRRRRRRQECPEMAASWRPGACACACVAAATTADSDQQVPISPLPPRRDDVHLASLHTPPPRQRDGIPPKLRPRQPIRRKRRRPRPNSDRSACESRSPLIPDPSREAGCEARRLFSVSDRPQSARRSGRRSRGHT